MQFGMSKEKQKRVSVYLKAGERAATSYYRFYQYFRRIDADVKFNLMIPDSKWNAFFPIASQPKWKQVYIFFFIYFRVLWNLAVDVIRRPDVVVISRCIINKVLPYSYRLLLNLQKRRGSKIVWDFDDNIVGAEMTRKNFDWFSSYASLIIVGSPTLIELINKKYQEKVALLPTTDGDMHERLTEEIKEKRTAEFDNVIRIIWVGTFSTLNYVRDIAPAIEKAGKILKENKKELHLIVVCDKTLDCETDNFVLHNVKWDKEVAITQMLQAHVGIMPLEDNEVTRGKCGFKLIQYLSVGLPVIGSTVGMNQTIINDRIGIGVDEVDDESWTNAIISIASDVPKWDRLSKSAYKEWELKYNVSYNLNEWNKIINQDIYVRN